MARAKRRYIPGYIWHMIHRCHKREFLLRFSKDRHRYLQWLYQARERYGLMILNYTVTSMPIRLTQIGAYGMIPRISDCPRTLLDFQRLFADGLRPASGAYP